MPKNKERTLTEYGIDLSHWNRVADWNATLNASLATGRGSPRPPTWSASHRGPKGPG
jgi:hypothetical protein